MLLFCSAEDQTKSFLFVIFSGGFGTFHAMLNCFIHVVMYTYYGMAALGPEYQKYIWWKKYLTKMQIVSGISYTLKIIFIFSNDILTQLIDDVSI